MADEPLRVLVLSGRNNHDWPETTPAIKAILEASGRFHVDVNDEPSRCTAATLAPYRAIVSNWSAWPDVTGRQWGPAMEKALVEFVQSGKGIVFVHAATATFHDWPEFLQMACGTWEIDKTGHGKYASFEVRVDDMEHPITKGLGPFWTCDELWHRTKFQPGIRILCSGLSKAENGGSGNWEPVLVTNDVGRGHCAYLVLGHDVAALGNRACRTLLARATEWTATGGVTIPAPVAWPACEPGAPEAARVDGVRILAGGQKEVAFQDGGSPVSSNSGGREVLEWRSADVPFKPYVVRLCTPQGVNILRDSPGDHKHHHGLMFAVKADGVNFWEEVGEAGHQVVREFGPIPSEEYAAMGGRIDWTDSKGQVLLREDRRIEVPIFADSGFALVNWETRLQPPAGKSSTELGGAHYHGLGMRFVESMDKNGIFFNESKSQGEVVRGDERLAHAKWSAYTAEVDGKPVTVAMFDWPGNPRPALWFTMSTPFAYMSATMNYWKEPLVVTAESPAVLKYAVAVWDGRVGEETVDALYRRWVATPPPVSLPKPKKGR